jgi:hypothetical protein
VNVVGLGAWFAIVGNGSSAGTNILVIDVVALPLLDDDGGGNRCCCSLAFILTVNAEPEHDCNDGLDAC